MHPSLAHVRIRVDQSSHLSLLSLVFSGVFGINLTCFICANAFILLLILLDITTKNAFNLLDIFP